MKRFCFAVDLKDDPQLITEYEAYHQNVWPEILQNIRNSRVMDMEIYRTGNRLFMIMETPDDYDPNAKAKSNNANNRDEEWETMMWKYQQALPWAKPGEKWVEMKRIFQLEEK